MVGPDNLILNCYRLADRYHLSPETFLHMPLSRVQMHVYYTVQLIEEQRSRTQDD